MKQDEFTKNAWASLLPAIVQLSTWDWVAESHLERLGVYLEKEKRRSVLDRNVLDMANPFGPKIFDLVKLTPANTAVFPLDFLAQDGVVTSANAIFASGPGEIQHCIGGTTITVPTPKFADAKDWSLDYARDHRFDVLSRAASVMINQIGQQIAKTQLSIFSAASNELQKTNTMEHLSSNITDMLVEPELMSGVKCSVRLKESIPIDGGTEEQIARRKEICDAKSLQFEGVTFHEVHNISDAYSEYHGDQFGVGNEQICFGFNLNKHGSFVMPYREAVCFPDEGESMKKDQRQGLYGWVEVGIACLDNDCVTAFEECSIETAVISAQKEDLLLPHMTTTERDAIVSLTKKLIEDHIEEVDAANSQSCSCASPRCTWRGSANCMYGM